MAALLFLWVMDYSYCLKGVRLDSKKLEAFGFVENKCCIHVTDEFYLIIHVNDGLTADLFDVVNEELYEPFNHHDYFGGYVMELREKAEEIILNMIEQCKSEFQLYDQIIEYVREKYNVEPDYPFEDSSIPVLRAMNKKWFGIFMWVDKTKLGIQEKGMCLILNTKTKDVSKVNNHTIFTAYHMNKKNWISVLIDNMVSFELIKACIDESYALVVKR